MAVKASASITLSFMVDIKATYRYYKLQASTASAPSAPTTYPPSSSSGWDDTEPRYTSGSTNTLYFVDCTVLTNNSFTYSKVSVSSSYEAAKEAYNKAQNAQNTANSANSKIDNLEIGGRNLLFDTKTMKSWKKGNMLSVEYGQTDYLYENNAVKLTNTKSDGSAGSVWFEESKFNDLANRVGKRTFSIWAKTDDPSLGGYLALIYRIRKNTSHEKKFYLSTEWEQYTFSYDVKEDLGDGYIDFIYLNVIKTSPIYICYPKHEIGNKATDWTPAPEDVDSAINAKIASVDVEYYLSTSATSLSGGSWVTTAPTWVNGKYMWSRTKITNGAGTVTYKPSSNGTCIAGAKGDTGATGATGATGNGVKTIVEQYYKSTSATSLSGGSWSATYPGWENGKYIWTRSVITYTNNSTTTTDAVCVTGQKGDTGSTGKGVKSSAVTYQASTSGTTIPTGTWSTSIPSVAAGSYLWTRTIITYTDNSTTTSYSVGKMGDTGATGATGPQGPTGATGKGVKSTEITYQAWSNGTSTPTGTWSSSPPATSASKPYLWTRTITTYTDNSTSTSYSVGSTPEGIVVGGRNLLRNTDNLTKWVKEYGISVTSDSDGWYKVTDSSHSSSKWGIYQDFSGYEQNTDYTISLYLKNGSKAGNLSIGYGGWGSSVITGSSNKTKYSYTFNTGSNTAALRIYINLAPTASGQNFYVKLPKLELGNKATDWSPAPEDVDEKIDDASKVATNYIDFTEGTGLVVGDMTSKTLGNNVLIDSDSVDIRNGTTVNSSFGASKIELGKNSDAASIKLINNRMTINVAKESSDNNYWANIVSKHLTLSPIERDDFFDTTIPKGGWPPYIYIKRIDKQVIVDKVSGVLYTGTVYVGCQQAYIRLDKDARGNSSYDSTGKITMHGSAIHVEGSNAIDFKTDNDGLLTKNSDYRIYGGRVIYSNSSGSTGTITLLETAANFSFLEIHYGNINYQLTTRVYDPNNKKVPLFFDYMVNSTTHRILTKKVTISAKSITTDTSYSGYGNIIDGGTIYVGTENSVKIYYVIGFK